VGNAFDHFFKSDDDKASCRHSCDDEWRRPFSP
jgi:hypothetical protein